MSSTRRGLPPAEPTERSKFGCNLRYVSERDAIEIVTSGDVRFFRAALAVQLVGDLRNLSALIARTD